MKAGETEAWRGDSKDSHAHSYVHNTDMHTGLGIYGNGSYMAWGKGARAYAWGYATPGRYKYGKAGPLMRLAIKAGARIADHHTLEQERHNDHQRYQQQRMAATRGTAAYKRASANEWLSSTLGLYAVARGFDGLTVARTQTSGGSSQFTWFNRTALRISDKFYSGPK